MVLDVWLLESNPKNLLLVLLLLIYELWKHLSILIFVGTGYTLKIWQGKDEEIRKGLVCDFFDWRTVRDRLQYLCDGAIKGINGEDNPVLEHVLIDLSTYDCDELVTSSLDLLTQMYFFEEELFNKAQQVSHAT